MGEPVCNSIEDRLVPCPPVTGASAEVQFGGVTAPKGAVTVRSVT